MRTHRTHIRTGLFLAVILILFMWFIWKIGTTQQYFGERYVLRAYFPDVRGLIVGAPVRLAGVRVGNVSSIKFPESLEKKEILVELSIDRNVMEKIREDSLASIKTMGLLGDKYVEITLGSADKTPLKNNDVIRRYESIEYEEIIGKGSEALGNLVEVSSRLNNFLREIEQRGTVEDLSRAIKGMRSFSEELEKRKMIERLEESISKINEIVFDIRNNQGLLNYMIYEKKGTEIINNLNEVLLSLKEVTQDLKTRKGLFYEFVYEEENRKLIEDMRKIASDLREIAESLEKGEGSLGALIKDPSLYERLVSLLEGADRSRLIKFLLRHYMEKGSK